MKLPPVLGGVPVPDVPLSDDFGEFSEIMSTIYRSDVVLLLFQELFVTDAEDKIVGISENLTRPDRYSAVDGRFNRATSVTLGDIEDEGNIGTYPRLRPWIPLARKVLETPRMVYENSVRASPFNSALRVLSRVYSGSGYRLVYPETMARAAVRYNLDENDPNRLALLEHLPCGRSESPTEATKWFSRDRADHRTEFTKESLVRMKPALLEYLEDFGPA